MPKRKKVCSVTVLISKQIVRAYYPYLLSPLLIKGGKGEADDEKNDAPKKRKKNFIMVRVFSKTRFAGGSTLLVNTEPIVR